MQNGTKPPEKQEFDLRAFLSGLGKFFRYNWMSLFIIFTYLCLIRFTPQGKVVLIDLLTDPLNLLYFMVIIYCIGHVISLYPVYFSKWRENKEKQKETDWHIHDEVLGLGIITYEYKGKAEKYHRNESILRKLVGLFFYFGVLYTIYDLAKGYELKFGRWLLIVLFVLLLVEFAFVTYMKYTPKYWCKLEAPGAKEGDKIPCDINKIKQAAELSLVLMLISGLATILLSIQQGWSFETLLAFAIHIVFASSEFIISRTFRKQLKYAKGVNYYYKSIAEDKLYLRITTFGGWFTLFIFLLAQPYPNRFNVAVIIFSFFYLLYGIIIIPIKHYFYYKRNENAVDNRLITKVWRFGFLYLLPLFWIISVGLNLITSRIGNDLHLLQNNAKISQETVYDMDEYAVELRNYFNNRKPAGERDTIYFVASYGGGLRANVWTQLVLDQLSNYKGRNIVAQTASLSGVSGGALGSAFYTATQAEQLDAKQVAKNMSKENFVSLDIAWVFGADYIRELNVFDQGKLPDRAKKAMLLYEQVFQKNAGMNRTAFEVYWAKLFQKKRAEQSFFPALLINSSSTNQKRGVASSVRLGKEFYAMFPGAIDILNHGDSLSLPFLYGVSPTHRFPIASPGAKISNKGIFLDGGYFENSGMLTTYDFYRYLRGHDSLSNAFWANKTIAFIQIDNNPLSYTKNKVNELGIMPDIRIKETGEIGNIQSALVSTSYITDYLEQSLKNSDTLTYLTISLPYKMKKSVVKNKIYKTTKLDCDFEKLIDKENERLKMVLTNESEQSIVEPVLGRLITEGAYNYMQAVLQEPDYVFSELDQFIEP